MDLGVIKSSLLGLQVLGVTINEIVVEDKEKNGEFCLIGKLMAKRAISKEIIISTMLKVWRPIGSISFRIVA